MTGINHDRIDSFERKKAITKHLREEVSPSLSLALVWWVERQVWCGEGLVVLQAMTFQNLFYFCPYLPGLTI